MKTLFIRNLPFDTSEVDLRKSFETFGRVHRCSIAKNRDTGESRGFGFVDIDDEAAPKAIADMNGRMFSNRAIVVQESDPRPRAGGAAPSGGAAPAGGGSRGPSSGGSPQGGGGGFRPGGASGSRPQGAGGFNRTAGPPGNRPGPSGPRAATQRSDGTGPAKQFGPPAAPAAERFKAYHDRPKDRLKPYKREHFDFREELEEDAENAKRAAQKQQDSEGDGAPPAAPPPEPA